jgi:gas vesicle protein
MSGNRINNVGWFLAGLGLGAVAGIFYAPKSGQELRADILNSMDKSRDSLIARSREARQVVNAWVETAKDVVDEKKEQIAAVADREIRSAKRQKDNVAAAIDAGREAYKAAADIKS